MRIARTTALGVVERLDLDLFETSPRVETAGRLWWLASEGGEPVGFAGMRVDGSAAYLARAGVLPRWRGRGLHGRLIRARVRHARALGCSGVYTYTMAHNAASGNNLIAAGFRLWIPRRPWFSADADVVYWRLPLDTSDEV